MDNIDYSLDFHPEAKQDYDDAFHWPELQESGLGYRFLNQMRYKLEQIIEQPETYGSNSKKASEKLLERLSMFNCIQNLRKREGNIHQFHPS